MDLEDFELDFEEIELLTLQLAITNLSLASIHGAEGRLDKAIKEYSKALEFDPGLYAGYVSRGRLFLRKGEPRKAIEDLSRAISLEPGVANTYLLRGDVFLEQGDSAAARRDYQTALELAPTNPEAVRRVESMRAARKGKPSPRRGKSGA